MSDRLDCVVVGGGIVGLAIGRSLALAGREVVGITDHLIHPDPTMATDALIYDLAGDTRLVVRPSGTEPKVKIYGEVVGVCGPDAAASFAEVDAEVAALLAAAPDDLGLPAGPD